MSLRAPPAPTISPSHTRGRWGRCSACPRLQGYRGRCWDWNPYNLSPQSGLWTTSLSQRHKTGIRISVGVRENTHKEPGMSRVFKKCAILSNVKEQRFLKQGILSQKKSLRKIRFAKGAGMGWVTDYSAGRSAGTSSLVTSTQTLIELELGRWKGIPALRCGTDWCGHLGAAQNYSEQVGAGRPWGHGMRCQTAATQRDVTLLSGEGLAFHLYKRTICEAPWNQVRCAEWWLLNRSLHSASGIWLRRSG